MSVKYLNYYLYNRDTFASNYKNKICRMRKKGEAALKKLKTFSPIFPFVTQTVNNE